MTKEKPPGDEDTSNALSNDENLDTLFSSDNTETTNFFSDQTDLSDFTEKVKNDMADDEKDPQDFDADVIQFRPKKK